MSFNLTVVFATAIVTAIGLALLPEVFAQINGENKILSGNVTKLVKEAQALYNLGNYSQAIRYFDKVLAINPHNIYTLTKKGAALTKLGNYSGAIEYFDKAFGYRRT